MVDRTKDDSMTQETMLEGVSASSHDERGLRQGDSVGRYVILGRVGAGGMGVVYSAYDPELDRKVALKLLHLHKTQRHSRSDGRSRLLREAQAMAKLSHPNVVTVHDVGLHDDRVFLAMEYVEGETLGAYMKRGEHTWREVLELFLAAGRGVAAAHEAGLVHRDFKPDNVLIREGGVAKVTDFGLARERTGHVRANSDAAKTLSSGDGVPAKDPDATEASLTRTGAVQGTPAYMSPEQHLGLQTDPSTDQFSFCVALYEGVYGQSPFAGDDYATRAMAVTEGKLRAAPSGSRVPGWLRDVLLRGLGPKPADRYPSMLALLDALSRDPSAGRRRILGWIAAAAVVGVAGFGLVSSRNTETELCSEMERHLAGVWDAEAKTRLRGAIDSAKVGFADSTYARVDAALDMYAAAWVEQRRESCEATQLRGEQSQTLMDRRMACLDGRLQALDSLVDVLSVGDAGVVQKAVGAVGELPDLAHCADAVALSAEVAPPDVAIAERVSKMRESLAQARALTSAGQYEPGLALAVDVMETARELEYPPLLVEALDRLGRLQHATGADKEAEATLEEAFFVAVRERLDDPAGRAASELVKVVGKTQARSADGRKWASHAQAHAAAAGDELIRAAAIMGLANVAHQESSFEEAKALAEEVLAIRTAQFGDKHAGLLPALNLLGLVASDTGKFDEATAHYTRGLELGREILGPDHPDLARFLNNLAKISWLQGKPDDAEKSFKLALDLQIAAFGPEHRNVAQLHNNLAAVAVSRGDMEEAGRRFKLALDIWTKALGPEHPSVADGLNNLAVVASALGRYEESRDHDERALAIRQRTMEPDHPAIAQNLNNLGEDLRHLGDLEGALDLHRKSLEIYEKKLGPDHDDVAGALTAIAYDLVLLGRAAEAVAPAQRALEIRQNLELDPMERANSKWTLALALWQSPRPTAADRKRARELAKEALAVFETGESEFTAAARAWVDKNG